MKLDLDPAAALVALAARCTFDDRQRSSVQAVLGKGPDWQRVLALAEQNYVLPLLFETLAGESAELVPKAVHAQLTTQRTFLKFRAELFCDELIRLSGILDASGLTVLHYKGPLASELLYGNRYRRTYFDLDFLVRREDLDGVARVLRNEGYRTEDLEGDEQEQFEREQKEYAFVSGLICIEPHWSLTARRYPFSIDYPGLWKRAVVHELGGVRLRTFSPTDMLMILSMAGAKGQWKRLQMVSDIAQCYRSMDPQLAQPVLDRARDLGGERILLVAAQLADALLEAPIPDAILSRIDKDRAAVENISQRVIRRLFLPKPPPGLLGDSPRLFSPLLFRMRERRRDKLAYLVRTTTTPVGIHLRRFPLPRWAYPAYRLLVPIHDYLLAPAARAVRGHLRRPIGP